MVTTTLAAMEGKTWMAATEQWWHRDRDQEAEASTRVTGKRETARQRVACIVRAHAPHPFSHMDLCTSPLYVPHLSVLQMPTLYHTTDIFKSFSMLDYKL